MATPSTTSTASAPSTPPTRRERARAATIEEIKQTALTLMRDQQSADVRFTDIAKLMGVTPPALYRYFADRDALLTHLIADSYDDLGGYVAAAIAAVDEDDHWGRWVAAAQAYRQWAGQAPEQFSLILGMPIAGFVADEAGPTTDAAMRAMGQLAGVFGAAQRRGLLQRPLIREVGPDMAICAQEKQPPSPDGLQLPAESFQALLNAWAGLHGFTSLEAHHHLDFMTDQARDELFAAQVQLIAKTAGLPTP